LQTLGQFFKKYFIFILRVLLTKTQKKMKEQILFIIEEYELGCISIFECIKRIKQKLTN